MTKEEYTAAMELLLRTQFQLYADREELIEYIGKVADTELKDQKEPTKELFESAAAARETLPTPEDK